MMLWFLFLALPLQEVEKPAKVKYEDLKIIAERNIFSPAKPKAKKNEYRKKEEGDPPKKRAGNPVIRGFVKFPDGYRILVYDPAYKKEVFHKIGEKVQDAEIIKISLEKAVLRINEKEKEIFTGSEIQRTDGLTMDGASAGKSKRSPTSSSSTSKPKARSPRLQKRLEELRKKKNKNVPLEVDDE